LRYTDLLSKGQRIGVKPSKRSIIGWLRRASEVSKKFPFERMDLKYNAIASTSIMTGMLCVNDRCTPKMKSKSGSTAMNPKRNDFLGLAPNARATENGTAKWITGCGNPSPFEQSFFIFSVFLSP